MGKVEVDPAEARRIRHHGQQVAAHPHQFGGGTGRMVEAAEQLLPPGFGGMHDAIEGGGIAGLGIGGGGGGHLGRVDLDFAHLFASWFNRGFLVLRQITWESPARLLEKIIGYEAVHEIGDWEALRARIDPPDRRCFAFFHPAMPDEPLIFVQVALVKGLPGSVQAILDPDRPVLDPATADTATFYSISNCQAGLKGISFGNSLIKHVVELLRQEFPHLKTFVTLSPIPGLARWLSETGAALPTDPAEALALRQQAARYLLEAKRGDGRPRDPVARFHLNNGARVYEVHAGADLSPRGLRQSCGAMVNYHYDPETAEEAHEEYARNGAVAATRGVRGLARAAVEAAAQTRGQTRAQARKERLADG